MDFRYFCDYFEKESYKHPKLSAFALTYLTNWGNEALEVSGSNRITPPSDTISDLLFFDLIGKSLMLNDDIYNFFKNYVTTYFNFISLNASQKKIESAGLYYLAESKQSKSKYKVFSLIGMKQVVGLTIKSRLSDYRVGFSANYEDPLDFKGGKFGIMFQKEARGYSDILITINDLENYKFKAYFTPPGFSPEGLTMMLGYMTDHSIALGLRLERSFSLTI